MYKNFSNTYYRLESSKYFLDNFKTILNSQPVNIWEMLFNLEAFCFFIKAVGSTFENEAKNIKGIFQLPGNKIQEITRLIKNYEISAKQDKAVEFLIKKRHHSKSHRINPDITFSLMENIEDRTVVSEFTLLMNPRTGLPMEIIQVGKIENLRFKDWDGQEDVLELCNRVYNRIQILALNGVLDVHKIVER